MENKIYYRDDNGEVIDDKYVTDTLEEFDSIIESSTGANIDGNIDIDVEKCSCSKQAHKISLKDLPEDIQKELAPYMLHS